MLCCPPSGITGCFGWWTHAVSVCVYLNFLCKAFRWIVVHQERKHDISFWRHAASGGVQIIQMRKWVWFPWESVTPPTLLLCPVTYHPESKNSRAQQGSSWISMCPAHGWWRLKKSREDYWMTLWDFLSSLQLCWSLTVVCRQRGPGRLSQPRLLVPISVFLELKPFTSASQWTGAFWPQWRFALLFAVLFLQVMWFLSLKNVLTKVVRCR